MTNKIQVHIDTLRYTRSGLATRNPLDLQVGARNEVVLVRPKRARPLRTGHCGFARTSAFPLPGTLVALWGAKPIGSAFSHHDAADPGWGGRCVQIYGHSSAAGGDDDNKGLAERRARVGAALLTSVVEG